MCMAIDAAIYMSNKIVDIYQSGKKEYQADFFKIHKLLYIAQGIMLSVYNHSLFKEEISAHTCGVYVGGLDTFYEMVGIQNIENKINDDLILLTPERKRVLDYVAEKYGMIKRDELISKTKEHQVYIDAYKTAKDGKSKPTIFTDDLTKFFCDNRNKLYPDFKGD